MKIFLLLFLFFSSPIFAATPRSLSYNVAPGYYNVGPAQYAVDDAGDTIAVWSVFNGFNTVLQYAYKPFGGDWEIPGNPGNPQNVITPFYYSVIDWTIAMDRPGNTVVVWRVQNRVGQIVVQAAYRPAGSGMDFTFPGDPTIPANFLNYYFYNIYQLPLVGIGSGNVTIVWTVFNGYNNVIQASLKTVGTDFSQPGNPTIAGNILNYLTFERGVFDITTPPLLDVDAAGNAVVAWEVNNGLVFGRGVDVVQATVNVIGGEPFTPQGDPRLQSAILSPRLYSISSLESAVIGSGNATVYWKRIDEQITGNLILQAAFKPANMPWEKPELQ